MDQPTYYKVLNANERAHRRGCLIMGVSILAFLAGFWGSLLLMILTGDWRGAVDAIRKYHETTP